MKSLLESGVHFGHQTRRWDPRMARFIFAERNGIHIIDLQKTLGEVKKGYEAVRKAVIDGKSVLFVGTKKQARAAVKREAERCNQFFVNHRWLGGMLTNFTTIRKSIIRLKKIEKMEVDGTFDSLVKKEKLGLLKEKEKLERNLGGIKNMDNLPGLIFIVDSKKESIAVTEARKLNIPIVAIVDTNCNPNDIDFPIPGNDDAIRAIDLFCSIIANACLDAENEASANIFDESEEEGVDPVKLEEEAINTAGVINKDKEPETIEEEVPVEDKKETKKDSPKKEEKKDKEEDSMAAVSMADVKKLRDATNAGMMDCKKSLEQADGNFDEALKILKEKGLADAKKRSDRETKEGGVYVKENGGKIAVALLGCETDFVANNEVFIKAKDAILDKIIETGNEDVALYNDDIQDAIAQIKENIELKNVKLIDVKDNQSASIYIHGNNKIGVVSVFELKDTSIKDNDKFKEFANNICLHITANSPYYVSEENVPASEIEEQKGIISKQMEGTDKPKEVLDKIIDGKVNKYFSEICLLKQNYVKDDKITVQKYIDTVSKELGTEIKITDFVRYMIGS